MQAKRALLRKREKETTEHGDAQTDSEGQKIEVVGIKGNPKTEDPLKGSNPLE